MKNNIINLQSFDIGFVGVDWLMLVDIFIEDDC